MKLKQYLNFINVKIILQEMKMLELEKFHPRIQNVRDLPASWISRIWSNKKVIFLIGDKVDTAKVHRLKATVETNVTFFSLARVTRRSNDQPLNIIEDAFIL